MAAAVFLLFVCAFFGLRALHSMRYPKKVITDFSSLPREGLTYYKHTSSGGFKASETDSHLYIDGEGIPIDSVEFDIIKVKQRRRYRERLMEVYYDLGDGFTEQQCLKSQLRKGRVRFDFDEGPNVQGIRADFFNNTKSVVRLRSITLNPDTLEHLPVFFAVSAAALFVLVCLTVKGSFGAYLSGILLWALLTASLGIPYLRDTLGKMTLPYLLFTALGVFLFSTMLLEDGRKKEILFTAAVCLAAFCVYFYWASVTPYAEGPDEAMRHDVAYYIAQHGTIPAGYEKEIRNLIWGFSYAYYPILPYIIGGYLEYAALRISDPSWMQLVMLARLVSIAAGTVSVFYTARLAKLLFPKSSVRYLLPVFAAFLPELAFINTYVNNDAMAIMTTSMILFYWAAGCKNGWRLRDAAGLSVGMGLCALTYYNCYGYILVSVPLFFYSITLSRKSAKEIARTTAFIVILTLAVCGWWFVRNAVLYNGDLLGRNTLNYYAEMYAQEGYKPSQLTNPMKEGQSLTSMLFEGQWIEKTLRSFIAMFSTYSLRAKHVVYTLYKVFLGAGLIGAAAAFLRFVFRKKQWTEEMKKRAAFWTACAAAIIIVLILAVYYSYAVDFQPQGRYILPCAIPLGCLLTAGFKGFGDIAEGHIGHRGAGAVLRRLCAAGITAFPAAIMFFVLTDTIYRYYVR